MASTVLPNGIIIPEKYSRDWYADLYHNWEELDNLLGGGTPKDGTLTIQKNGTTLGTFSANQATDETIDIAVPDVNNGALTIQQNGTTVDTFTANSSTDKTVNIQCVDLNSNQTVGGIKTFSNAPVVNSINLDGKTIDTDANGNMTFNGNIVDTIEEQGDGYIRYSNGIQICWGKMSFTSNSNSWGILYESEHAASENYPKSFISPPVVTAGSSGHVYCLVESAEGTTTGTPDFFAARPLAFTNNSFTIDYIAIGYWK